MFLVGISFLEVATPRSNKKGKTLTWEMDVIAHPGFCFPLLEPQIVSASDVVPSEPHS